MKKHPIDEIRRIMADLPKNPVAPENRGAARLRITSWISSGRMYRVAQPDQSLWPDDDCQHPLILMNPVDVAALRAAFVNMPFGLTDQVLADIAEQLFAEQEAEQGLDSGPRQ